MYDEEAINSQCETDPPVLKVCRRRHLPVGAEVIGTGVHFRVWAPYRKQVSVLRATQLGAPYPLNAENDGYFSGTVVGMKAGDRYKFILDDVEGRYPDPVSRFQPEGPHGWSQVIDPDLFEWSDQHWQGYSLAGQVIYELHVGTFTPEGTWAAAAVQLPELARLGISVIEVMPVGDFPGRFGWGYDGVNLFAPTRLYGTPDDFRAFVNAAHLHGIAVILDVVYNHFGPDGNYIAKFGPYLSQGQKNDWGESINFDGPDAGPVREFYLANARYWVNEFHIDGLRIDATQAIIDNSPEHILTQLGQQVRESAGKRATILIVENEPQESRMLRSYAEGGYGLDGIWNDDFHHLAAAASSGRRHDYYLDYLATPQEFVSAAKYGFLYQGQRYSWQEQRRGQPAFDLASWRFINFLQNHDQVANSMHGLRFHQQTSPGRYRALTALLLLLPGTPMLFQGQEFAASTPFYYFADHQGELAGMVLNGRAEFLQQFPSLDRPDLAKLLSAPHDLETFTKSKLDFRDRVLNKAQYQLHQDLLHLRKSDPAFRPREFRSLDGAVLGPAAFVLRYFEGTVDGTADRLLLVNLGSDLHLDQAPEPLLAPPSGYGWDVLWSSEDVRYAGSGTPSAETIDGWHILGEAAMVLAPTRIEAERVEQVVERARLRRFYERTRMSGKTHAQ